MAAVSGNSWQIGNLPHGDHLIPHPVCASLYYSAGWAPVSAPGLVAGEPAGTDKALAG
jgi:hypothetical protein